LNFKLQEPIYVPPEGADKLVTGDLGNGIVITPRNKPTSDAEKHKLIGKYKKKFPDEITELD